jgi:hypothetical protein
MNFKKFSTSDNQWHAVPYYQHKTATDTLSLPATLYPDDTSITVGIKGQSSQSGTPSPSNPVSVDGVGELETSGEHAGQYKIPILLNSTTINKYLGTEQTVRQIKKLVLDGTENWKEGTSNYYIFIDVQGSGEGVPNSNALCTHAENSVVVNNNGTALFFNKSVFVQSSLADFKTYLQQQYTNGTPVCVWYVLATPQTAVVNEPLMKIGSYSDSLSTTIPCTAGENTLDVQTTVQPSEFTATWKGWHDSSVKEYDGTNWQ